MVFGYLSAGAFIVGIQPLRELQAIINMFRPIGLMLICQYCADSLLVLGIILQARQNTSDPSAGGSVKQSSSFIK